MLVRMWRNGTPHTLPVGMYDDVAALKKWLAVVPHKVRVTKLIGL